MHVANPRAIGLIVELGHKFSAPLLEGGTGLPSGLATIVATPLDEIFSAALVGAALEESVDEVFVGLELSSVGESAIRT